MAKFPIALPSGLIEAVRTVLVIAIAGILGTAACFALAILVLQLIYGGGGE